jgi:large subunit ribosomal protein L9
MRIILREDLDNLGHAGEVVSVRDGYGRNYLLPRGLAVPATERDVARMDHEKRVATARAAKLAKDVAGQVERLSKVSVTLTAAVGEEGKLYGSITSRDIVDAIKEQGGVVVDVKKLHLAEPIKTLGVHEVSIKLGKDAVAKVNVSIVKKE